MQVQGEVQCEVKQGEVQGDGEDLESHSTLHHRWDHDKGEGGADDPHPLS